MEINEVKAAADLTIRYPAAKSCLPAAATTPLHAATCGEKEKDAAWREWAESRNRDWAPLAMETTGSMAERMVKWLRRRCAENDGPLAITTCFDAIVGAMQTKCLEGTSDLFASARGEKIKPGEAGASRVAARPSRVASGPLQRPSGTSPAARQGFHPTENNPFFTIEGEVEQQ